MRDINLILGAHEHRGSFVPLKTLMDDLKLGNIKTGWLIPLLMGLCSLGIMVGRGMILSKESWTEFLVTIFG